MSDAIKEQFIRFGVLFQGCEAIRGGVGSPEMDERLPEIALQWSHYVSG